MNNDFDFSEIDELLEKQAAKKTTPKISKKASINHEKRLAQIGRASCRERV